MVKKCWVFVIDILICVIWNILTYCEIIHNRMKKNKGAK